MKDILIFGAGGHSYAVVELIKSLHTYRLSVIYDDHPRDTSILEIPVVKYQGEDILNTPLCVAIGDNAIRKSISQKLKGNYPTFIHNSAIHYPSVKIGKGTMVFPNVVLDADVHIGDFCIINNQATISHNAKIGHFCHIAINAALAGNVSIGEGTLIGVGSIVLPGITVGKWATIGAGALVTKNVPDHAVVYGNPAKIIRYNNDH